MLRNEWLVQHDRRGRPIKLGADVRVVSEGVVGIVRSVGTRAWIDVDGVRRGFAFSEIELLPEQQRRTRTGPGRRPAWVGGRSQPVRA